MASSNLSFAFFCILLLHILQSQAISAASKQSSASTNIKEGASNFATGTEQRLENAAAGVGQAVSDIAKGTSNVVGKGISSVGNAMQSSDHPEDRLASSVHQKTEQFREGTEQMKKTSGK